MDPIRKTSGFAYGPLIPHGATVYTETDNAWLLVRKQKLSY